jgi:hypothetical protein
MIDLRDPKYRWGQSVCAAVDLYNDGSLPDVPETRCWWPPAALARSCRSATTPSQRAGLHGGLRRGRAGLPGRGTAPQAGAA